MKKLAMTALLALLLAGLAAGARAGVPGALNQKMATRSGPGTKYTEELGTLPQDTAITIIHCVETNGTPWCLVEFRQNGRLYRCYTGLKRIDTAYALPEGPADYRKDTVTRHTDVYYGPGTNYAQRKGSLSKGEEMRVFEVEGSWALVEYKHGGAWQRGYIPVDCLKKTEAVPTPAPTAVPTAAPVTAAPAWAEPYPNNILDRTRHLCVDYYGQVYNYGGHDDDFVYMVGQLPVMSYFDGVPCIKHTDVYSGPGPQYWRRWIGGQYGYAYTGILDTNLRVYCRENGWILIRYPSDNNQGYRYGWVAPTAISPAHQDLAPRAEFAWRTAVTKDYCDATDDPDRSLQYQGTTISAHIRVTALAFLNEDRDWVYCEYTIRDGGGTWPSRGFLPATALMLEH